MMHTLWNFRLLLVSPSIRSNRDHFLQADFPVLIRTMAIWITSVSPTIRKLIPH
jgi:hypothetical protein